MKLQFCTLKSVSYFLSKLANLPGSQMIDIITARTLLETQVILLTPNMHYSSLVC